MRKSLYLFLLLSTSAFAGKLEKGFERLKIYDYFLAKECFEKTLEDEPAAAAFGLSSIYAVNNNPFFNLDSARKYILISDSSFHALKPKQKMDYSILGVTDSSIALLNAKVCHSAFLRAKEQDNLAGWEHYLSIYANCADIDSAIIYRDAVAFRMVKEENTSSAYRNYSEKYPKSLEAEEADDLYKRRLFEERTADGKIVSYENFMHDFPESPYYDEAERMIYSLSTAHRTVREYAGYARKYPNSKYAAESWRQVYTLSMKDFSEQAFQSFRKNYPDYPFANELESDFRLQNFLFLPILKNEKWGYQNENGEEMIPTKYEEAEEFSEGLAAVAVNGLFGYVNKRGVEVIVPQFVEAEAFHEGVAVVMKDSLYGMINRTGEWLIKPQYDDLSSPSENICVAVKGEKYGFLLKNGKSLSGFVYDFAGDFKDGCAIVTVNEKSGLINNSGKFIVEPQYDEMQYISGQRLKVSLTGKWGMIDKHNQQILPIQYDAIGDFLSGLAIVTQNGKCGFVNDKGEIKIPLKYSFNSTMLSGDLIQNGFVILKYKQKKQLIDTSGTVFPLTGFEDFKLPGNNLIPAKKNRKWGYIWSTGKTAIPFSFEDAMTFDSGFAIVRQKGQFGVIDTTGKIVVNPIYDSIELKNDYFVVGKSAQLGLLNTSGNLILPCQYSEIEFITNKILKVQTAEGFAYVNLGLK
ncbi:MAG: WG repeat-containing protein [Bacteroidia bacterium]